MHVHSTSLEPGALAHVGSFVTVRYKRSVDRYTDLNSKQFYSCKKRELIIFNVVIEHWYGTPGHEYRTFFSFSKKIFIGTFV